MRYQQCVEVETGAIALVQALQMQRSGRTVCMVKTHKTARVQFGPNNAAVCLIGTNPGRQAQNGTNWHPGRPLIFSCT